MPQTLLQRLIERRDKLDAAIEVIRQETGEREEKRAYRKAAKALHVSNGGAPAIAGILARSPKKKRKEYPVGMNRPAFRGDREIKKIAVPSGVSFEGVPFNKAVALAVRAVGEPIPTPELRLLLETAGVKFPKLRQPRNRYVGMIASKLAAAGDIKRTDQGWQAAKK